MSDNKAAATFHPESPEDAAKRLADKTTMSTDAKASLTHYDEDQSNDDHS